MLTERLSTFFAVLSLAALAGTVVVILLAAVRRVRPDSALGGLFDGLQPIALWLAWLVAAVTMAGSLYYSLGAHFLPCELCWYQRICVYPLALVLLVAAIRKETRVWLYVVPIATIGVVIASYHTQLQAYPKQATFCAVNNPCTNRYAWEFGFVSLPFMDLTALLFIIAMVLVARTTPTHTEEIDG